MFALGPVLLWFYVMMLCLGILGNRPTTKYIVDETGGKYDVQIICVEYHTQNYAYATVPEKGEYAQYVSGLTPEVTFSMMNMSDKPRLIPIPNYFYITTDYYNKHHPKGVVYDKVCDCYSAYYACEPMIPDGVGYNEVKQFTRRKIGDKYALHFGPWEIKKFTVPFLSNFPENEETFTFCGFSQTDKFTGKKVDVAYEIGVADKKVKSVYLIK